MPREVTDGDGTTWSLAEAYAGLSEDGRSEAARIGDSDRFRVIATPSGGAQSVEMELPAGWADDLSDNEILKEIANSAE